MFYIKGDNFVRLALAARTGRDRRVTNAKDTLPILTARSKELEHRNGRVVLLDCCGFLGCPIALHLQSRCIHKPHLQHRPQQAFAHFKQHDRNIIRIEQQRADGLIQPRAQP